ncbi:DUF1080 domain-containing protein [bacterium]|nr:DUF1080 domain-containing protein [bacterium]
MKAVTVFLFSCLLVSAAVAADARYVIDDPFVGVYSGRFVAGPGGGKAEAQIRSLGNGSYDGFIALKTPVDGEDHIFTIAVISPFQPGADQKAKIGGAHPNTLQAHKDNPDKRLSFPELTFRGEVSPGKISGEFSGPFASRGTFTYELSRIAPPQSPTLDAPAPKGAVVLFDGKDLSQWKASKWKINDGVLEVGDGNLIAKQSLTNFVLHLEFRTPNMPEARGQGRGNSGVYLRSVFEVQVLDSFGLFPLADNDCGGIYKVKAPAVGEVNACLPPGVWQTYDITFRDGDQKSGRAPVITVVQNGKTIVDNAKVPMDLFVNGTGGGEVGGGFLMLQNHGNAVQYRNIWAQPIE